MGDYSWKRMIEIKLDQIVTLITAIQKGVNAMSAVVDALVITVQQTEGVIDSAVTTLNYVVNQLSVIQGQLAVLGVDNETLNTLRTDLEAKKAELAAAIAAAPQPPTP